MSEEKREYWIPFKGCRPLNKRRANTAGITLLCGLLATAVAAPTLGRGIASGALVLVLTILGYFLGKKLFEI
jgi:uncharacterized membrane protein